MNMAEVVVRRAPKKPDVYCYNEVTDADEVNATLHALVKQLATTKNIWVVSGTHGTAAGTVSAADAEADFKKEDLDSASVTSRNIKIKNYPLLSTNTWKELREKKGETNTIVLAFCFSSQWFNNSGPGGNDGKL
jgi:hypothetical protein